ncbi:MAG: sugar phosphate isomerase/epimerase [Candidatus Riflebacteria bacterium]|nr:sugar phosphate isomerase/epimerase [Candidatus Riflebacteria bacterium]
MKFKLHTNIPIRHLRPEDLELLLNLKMQPEIYFAADLVDSLSADSYKELVSRFNEKGFEPSFHGPFFDLSLGAYDPKVRALALERMLWTINAAKDFKASQIVLHPGYGPWVLSRKFDEWYELAIPVIKTIVKAASDNGIKIAFENIYDNNPNDLKKIVSEFSPEHVGVCFDTGHFNLFSDVPMKTWLETLSDRIIELHVHDNDGQDDHHIAIGDGCVKYTPLINWLHKREQPLVVTIEMVLKTHVIKSVPIVREWIGTEGKEK